VKNVVHHNDLEMLILFVLAVCTAMKNVIHHNGVEMLIVFVLAGYVLY
jgi:hypothetical protein